MAGGRPRDENPTPEADAMRRSRSRAEAHDIGERLDLPPYLRFDRIEETDALRVIHYYGDDLARFDSRGDYLHYCDERGVWQRAAGWTANGYRLWVKTVVKASRVQAVDEVMDSEDLFESHEQRDFYASAFLSLRVETNRHLHEVGETLISSARDVQSVAERDEYIYPQHPVIPLNSPEGGAWDVLGRREISRAELRELRLMDVEWAMSRPDFAAWDNPSSDVQQKVKDLLANHYGADILDRLALGLLGPDKRIEIVKGELPGFGKSTLFDLLRAAFGAAMVEIVGERSLANLAGRFTPIHNALAVALFVVVDEVDKAGPLPTSKINEMVGRYLSVEKKGIDPYTIRRLGTLWFVGNDWAQLDADAPGIADRMDWALDFGGALSPSNYEKLTAADARALTHPLAGATLQAFLLRRAAELGEGAGEEGAVAAAKWQTRNSASKAALESFRGERVSPALDALRDVYEAADDSEFALASQIPKDLAAAGIPKSEIPKTRELSAIMRRLSPNIRRGRRTLDGKTHRVWLGLRRKQSADAEREGEAA